MIDLVSSFSADGKFRFCCESCGNKYAVAPSALGRKGKCSKCNEKITVPNPIYDVTYFSQRFFSLTLLKAKRLEASELDDLLESAYAIVNGRPIPLRNVFPLEAIPVGNVRPIANCLAVEARVKELREIYPEETDLFSRLDGNVSLANLAWHDKTERGEKFCIALGIYGESLGSADILIYVGRRGKDVDSEKDNLKVVKASLPETGSELLDEQGPSIFIRSRGQNQIISNMRSNLGNDIQIEFKWSNDRGIILEDRLTLPGNVVERLLLMVNPKLCSEFGGIRSFDSRSEIAFYEYEEKIDLPNEDAYDEEGTLKVVYILVNPSMPGIVKIGRTTQGVFKRMEQLNTTGVALPYECFYAAFVHDDVEVERALHEHFSDCRVNQRREFFEVSPQKVMRELFQYDLGDATDS